MRSLVADVAGFRTRIKQVRKAQALTIDDLAALMGVSNCCISKWENGITFPQTANLIKLAKTLNTSMAYLCGGVRLPTKQAAVAIAGAQNDLQHIIKLARHMIADFALVPYDSISIRMDSPVTVAKEKKSSGKAQRSLQSTSLVREQPL